MEERDFFDEKPEQRTHTMTCPHCGQPASTRLDGLFAARRRNFPRGADERDRARFAKAQSYYGAHRRPGGMPRTSACRKRFGSSRESSPSPF